jgi:hypothetical protein
VEADIARLESVAEAALAALPTGSEDILGALVRSATRRSR